MDYHQTFYQFSLFPSIKRFWENEKIFTLTLKFNGWKRGRNVCCYCWKSVKPKCNQLSKFLRRSLLIFIIKVFKLLSSSLLLFPQRFGRYVLWPSSGVCRTTSFIETTGVACSDSVCHNRVQVLSIPVYHSPVVRIEPATFRWLSS